MHSPHLDYRKRTGEEDIRPPIKHQQLIQNSAETCPICATLCDYFFDVVDDEKVIPRDPDRHGEFVSLKYGLLYPDDETDKIRWIFQFYCPLTRDAPTNGNHIGNLAVKPVLGEDSDPLILPSFLRIYCHSLISFISIR